MEMTDAVSCLFHNRRSQFAAFPSLLPRTTPRGPANGLLLPPLAPKPELVRRRGKLDDTPRGTGDGSGMVAFTITGEPLTGVLGRRLLRGRGLSVGKLATEADRVLGVMRSSLLSLMLSPGLFDYGQRVRVQYLLTLNSSEIPSCSRGSRAMANMIRLARAFKAG